MAALCLGIKLFEELPSKDAQGHPVIGALSGLALNKAAGLERLVTMGVLALGECAGGQGGERLPLLLCTPEPGDALVEPEDVLRGLAAQSPVGIDGPNSRAFAGGRGALFPALQEAARLLEAGVFRACYLGGVDSLVDEEALDAVLRAGRVKTAAEPEGFVPGEGAVFLRIAARSTRGTLATIAGIGEARETAPRGSSMPNHGIGLAQAARAALNKAGVRMDAVGIVVHDAAGDRFGFREAALGLARLRPRAEPPPSIWTPATVTGEIRAAYAPLALAQAAFFLHKKVSAGPGALVLGAAAGPARGAALLLEPR
jgi:3-oxoacyl-(acyl-carrier-protein) synthase